MNIDIEQAKDNEAQVIYDMMKASGTEGVVVYPSTLKGIEATAIVNGKTITLTYVDGTISSYTEL